MTGYISNAKTEKRTTYTKTIPRFYKPVPIPACPGKPIPVRLVQEVAKWRLIANVIPMIKA